MSDDFEALLDRMVPGTGRRGEAAARGPELPPELALERLGLIARGSVGWLYRARDPLLDRRVAVKISRPDQGRAAAERLLQEARVTARLQHTAVLPVHRALDLGETACVVFRLAPRLTLYRLLYGDMTHLIEAFSLHDRLRMCREGASALARAHGLGLTHGDLHPGNIAVGDDGEPYVLDWGGVSSDGGGFSGHPAYAAPEQLRGAPPTAAGDVYAIAAVTWEVMTLRALRPRGREESLGDWLGRLQTDAARPPPEPPGEMDPTLGEVLQRGLSPEPADRPSAQEFVAAAGEILTGQDERRRRRAEASSLLAACAEALEHYQDLADRLGAEQKVAAVQRAKIFDHAPPAQKRPLWETERRVRRLLIEQEITWVDAVEDGVKALTLAPEDPRGRQTLADLWWARFRQAESGSSPAEMAMALSRVQRFDDGRYQRALSAPALISLSCPVPGATARLERFEPSDRVLSPEWVADVELPLRRHRTSAGTYRLVVEAPGFAPAIYPLALRRREHHRGEVRLYTPAQIGDGWVQMAGGPFHMGGDPLARLLSWRIGGRGPLRSFSPTGDPLARQALESCSPTVSDRFVMRSPVTSAEWLTFLRDLPEDEAAARRPGEAGLHDVSRAYWPMRGGLPELPYDWDPRWPVMAISLEDAEAYAVWLSDREGRPVRLPTEEEWEKAARGVDGRAFPWGAEFDPTFAHMRRSRPGPVRPARVASYPIDTSVWGCTDMAGCVREWTSSAFGEGQAVVRGGSWQDDEDDLRSAGRVGLDPTLRYSYVGFRLISEVPLR